MILTQVFSALLDTAVLCIRKQEQTSLLAGKTASKKYFICISGYLLEFRFTFLRPELQLFPKCISFSSQPLQVTLKVHIFNVKTECEK